MDLAGDGRGEPADTMRYPTAGPAVARRWVAGVKLSPDRGITSAIMMGGMAQTYRPSPHSGCMPRFPLRRPERSAGEAPFIGWGIEESPHEEKSG